MAFVLGVFFMLFMAEAGLRLIGALQIKPEKRPSSLKASGEFRVLFLGNSHTAGAGTDPQSAYPNVIDRALMKMFPAGKIRAFNLGQANANTTILRERIPSQILEYQPDLVFIMAGEPNAWNPFGYADYLHGKKSAQSEAASRWREWLLQVRLFRWISLLPSFQKTELDADQKNEQAAYNIMALLIDNYHSKTIFTLEEAIRIKQEIHLFIERHRNENLPVIPYFFQILAHLEIRYFKNLKTGLALYEKGRKETLSDMRMPYANDLMAEIIQPDSDEGRVTRKRILAAIVAKDLKECAKLARLDPGNSFLQREVMLMHLQRKDYLSFAKSWEEYLRANPLQIRDRNIYYYPKNVPPYEKEATAIIARTRDWFRGKFPTESLRFTEEQDTAGWIESDLSWMVREFQKSGATVVLQNYHWLRHKLVAGIVTTEAKKIAEREKIFFLDTWTKFDEGIVSDRQSYFSPEYGPGDDHPSAKGHALIAGIILKFMDENKLLPTRRLSTRI